MTWCNYTGVFFFFQAEDGIRDIGVTGVQTCALPILLTLLFMSFGYVMLTICVPDHFCLSMMLLLLTLWRSGKLMKEGRQMGVGETVWLFVFTAGVALDNRLKKVFWDFFGDGKRFFQAQHLFGAGFGAML